ncbi:predicted protein [Arabidopsis lyrata subsp. lyrata]|uniref:Predicted protein n=1 Tax=Arabidopsis lyrata subsp. lyrata TaxID=81972 RepID=D7M9A1_ARALL|nr:predicted protein [Arabidopsis lyrata subsp. lyrata]
MRERFLLRQLCRSEQGLCSVRGGVDLAADVVEDRVEDAVEGFVDPQGSAVVPVEATMAEVGGEKVFGSARLTRSLFSYGLAEPPPFGSAVFGAHRSGSSAPARSNRRDLVWGGRG